MTTKKILSLVTAKGYGVYNIEGGKLDPAARFAVADPADDDQGFYLEGSDLAELMTETIDHLETP
jgi:hypothetical protein